MTGTVARVPEFQQLEHLCEIDNRAWDALAGKQACLTHAFLSTLEDTGCVGPGTGWTPRHLILRDHDAVLAALPQYEKQHSYGEYVFDWAWADAYARHGLAYYPKRIAAIPFTPIPGQRLLATNEQSRRALLTQALTLAEHGNQSSFHVLFPPPAERDLLQQAGLLLRHGVQFHWLNTGDDSFDAFLNRLSRDKRKKIRQERRRAAEHALTYRWLDGHSATQAEWAWFHRCYANTYARHRSTPYLNLEFFVTLAARAPLSVQLLLAERDGQAVASAFFLCDQEALYGRYWGASEPLPFLHFEMCYYQAIEYCIAHGLSRFEGGAQGEHKLARGMQPVATCSAHWIGDPRFRDAVDRHLALEAGAISMYLDELNERSPFRTPAPEQ
jgi:predicted N-acyltransferase